MPGSDCKPPQPSPWVVCHAKRIPAGGQVLDLACGSGRHTRWLHELGYPVFAADINLDGLTDLLGHPGIELLETDLEQNSWPFEEARFAGIVVTNYLYRPHIARLAGCLIASGVLIYESFAAGNEEYGKPSNPNYLLQPGELLEIFTSSLQVIAFEQGLVNEPNPKVVQRICAVRP